MSKPKNTLTKEQLKRAMELGAVATALVEMPDAMLTTLASDVKDRGVNLTPEQVRGAIQELLKWALEDEME